MSNAPSTLDVPKNPVERRVWVCGQLRLRGTSLRQLGIKAGVSPQAMSAALLAPNRHLEHVIAEALGLTARQLFPERFTANGDRIHQTRPQQRTTKRLSPTVKTDEAA